jgi:hypothetical protein
VAVAGFLAWNTWGADFVAANQDNWIGTTADTVHDGSMRVADEVTQMDTDDWKIIGVTASVMVLLSTFFRFKRWLRNRGASLPGVGAFFPDAAQAVAGSTDGALRDIGKIRKSVRVRLLKGQGKGWTQMNLKLGRVTRLASEQVADELRGLGYTVEPISYRNGKRNLKVSWRPQERAAPLT